jgi:predicted ATP-dependent serine protease
VETPWKVVNNVLRGGLRQTKLGVILAPPGVGKSWVLCNLATHAIKTGKKVIYYSLEMTE